MKGWHKPLVSLLEATDVNNISGHPAYDRDPYIVGASPYSRIVFAGDSAHCMSPFKGQGANQALLDSISLSRAIASSDITNPKKRSYRGITILNHP